MRTVQGLTLTFHLAGINNQNFLMRDDQTGTFWQQISGRAVSGPLAGSQLGFVHSDELSFGLWRGESPRGTVLKPVPNYIHEYASKDWDVRMASARTVLDFPNTALKSRELILGVESFGASRAYPVERILKEKLIQDRIGGEPVLVVLGPDERSMRVFQARPSPDAAPPDYYRLTASSTGAGAALFMDSLGNSWNFSGYAVNGPAKGSRLRPVYALKDYWFDWRNYHPSTSVFAR